MIEVINIFRTSCGSSSSLELMSKALSTESLPLPFVADIV